jgi:peroxiredoxin
VRVGIARYRWIVELPRIPIILLALLLLESGCSRRAVTPIDESERTGAPLTFAFTAADGRTVDLAQLRGKVVLRDFWATWCQPCLRNIPELVRLHERYSSRGLQIIGISLDLEKERMLSFANAHGMAWPQLFDPEGWAAGIAGSRGIPLLYLVDKQGRVAAQGHPQELALEESIERLLAEPFPPATSP